MRSSRDILLLMRIPKESCYLSQITLEFQLCIKDTMDYINTNIITKSLKSLRPLQTGRYHLQNHPQNPTCPVQKRSQQRPKRTYPHAPPRPSHQQKIATLSTPVSVETRSIEEQSKVPNHRPQKPTYTHSRFTDRRHSAFQNSDERMSSRQLRRMKRRLFLEAVNSSNQPIQHNKISPRNSMRLSKRRSTGRE